MVIALLSLAPLFSAERIDPAGITGTLVLAGNDSTAAVRRPLADLAGGEYASLVVVAADSKERPLDETRKSELAVPWLELGIAECNVVSNANDTPAAERRAAAFKGCTGVWVEPDVNVAPLSAALLDVRKRDAIVGLSGANAAGLGEFTLNDKQEAVAGANELPGTLIALSNANRKREVLQQALAAHPGSVGLEIGDSAALIVRQRELYVAGPSKVTVLLSPGAGRPARIVDLSARQPGDLTEFRRAALARTSASPIPATQPPTPNVPSGSLVIVGGGGMPPEVTRKFIELAGGPEAPIVVLPTANPDPLPARDEGAFFRRAGARHVTSLRARELSQVESAANLAVLKEARGIWFGGGRQWRFVDAYENTQALELMRDVLRRGGVIGGSSAGATIQGDYLCRGSPLGPHIMLCEGYERGFAFLPGVAIDQHFTQRKRFPDMTALMRTYPQFLGLGLDEATALIVQGHTAEIMGPGAVHFYNTRAEHAADKPDYEALKAGERYDLETRTRITPPEKK